MMPSAKGKDVRGLYESAVINFVSDFFDTVFGN